MKYCRIDLSKTNYSKSANSKYIVHEDLFPEMFDIYRKYCKYKKFDSVMPLFEQQFRDTMTEIIGYFSDCKLVAFSLIKLYDAENAEAVQFAWNYADPKLRLGIESLHNECAIYKQRGFKYLYLGQDAEYKRELDGFEILGRL